MSLSFQACRERTRRRGGHTRTTSAARPGRRPPRPGTAQTGGSRARRDQAVPCRTSGQNETDVRLLSSTGGVPGGSDDHHRVAELVEEVTTWDDRLLISP
jgi:hypothetical protein